jgi:hypothetical protein
LGTLWVAWTSAGGHHTVVDEFVVVHTASVPPDSGFANTASQEPGRLNLGILSAKGVLRASGKIFTPEI